MTSGTKTGGREATEAVVPGRYALSIGRSDLPAPAGFEWKSLTSLARLESGHTPSRARNDYWGGPIPWIGIKDATQNHGLTLTDTQQHVTQAGLDNSSARLLPAGTVCLSRTASVGYVVIMGTEMATSQDFVNWVCGNDLSSSFLRYLLMAEQESVRKFAFGSVHQTLYYPDAKALYVCVPSLPEQDAISAALGALDEKIAANSTLALSAGELAVTHAATAPSTCALSQVGHLDRTTISPEDLTMGRISHYSLPAFDTGVTPSFDSPTEIKSSKFWMAKPLVLISKLNPRIPRIWAVDATTGLPGVASTEFMPVVADTVSYRVLWAAVSGPEFGRRLEAQVAGTSGSHQRVRPEDLMATEIADPRRLSARITDLIDSLVSLCIQARSESGTLRELRDTLLPALMSGQLRIKDAERQVEDAV